MTASINPQATTPTVSRTIRIDPARAASASRSVPRDSTLEALPVSRSLVPVESGHPSTAERAIVLRPAARHAAFHAHLIATNARAPQTCARRRIAPQDGALAYRAAATASAVPAPRMLRTA